MNLLDPVGNEEWVAEARRLIDLAAAAEMTVADASYEWLRQLKLAGYDAGAAKGTLEDLGSQIRRKLIFDVNIELIHGHRRWSTNIDADILDAYPAAKLVKGADDGLRTKWKERWLQAGGQLVGRKMMALWADPIWARVSWFGLPWEPLEPFHGILIEEVDRQTAQRAGLLTRSTRVPLPRSYPRPAEIFFLTAIPPHADLPALAQYEKRARAMMEKLSRRKHR